MATIHELAGQLHGALGTRTRDDGSTYVCLTDDAPEWAQDVVRDAHGVMLPDDWRYLMIQHCAEWFSDEDADPDDPTECADSFVPAYNSDRLEWLASNTSRSGYVDDAVAELGNSDGGVMGDIGLGIYWECEEVYAALAGALRELADED